MLHGGSRSGQVAEVACPPRVQEQSGVAGAAATWWASRRWMRGRMRGGALQLLVGNDEVELGSR